MEADGEAQSSTHSMKWLKNVSVAYPKQTTEVRILVPQILTMLKFQAIKISVKMHDNTNIMVLKSKPNNALDIKTSIRNCWTILNPPEFKMVPDNPKCIWFVPQLVHVFPLFLVAIIGA